MHMALKVSLMGALGALVSIIENNAAQDQYKTHCDLEPDCAMLMRGASISAAHGAQLV